MAKVLKIIWRLDFPVSHEFLDRRGTALRLLVGPHPDKWTAGEGDIAQSLVAEIRGAERYVKITMEPRSINGTIEWNTEVKLDRCLEHQDFRSINQITNSLLGEMKISRLTRCGIRLIGVETSKSGHLGQVPTDLIRPDIVAPIQSIFENIEDHGVLLEGVTADAVKYRLNFGPAHRKNILGALGSIEGSPNLDFTAHDDVFFDLDLYETNISFMEHNLFKWAVTKLAKAIDFAATLREKVDFNIPSTSSGAIQS